MPAHPDLIVWGARVRTLDPAQPPCSAVAIKDGPILALGSDWIVAPFDPRIGMACARLRRAPGHLKMPTRAGAQALRRSPRCRRWRGTPPARRRR